MARLEVHLLGQFNLTYKNKPIKISSRPAQSLFAYLILNTGTSYRREKLAGMLWPDFSEETARDNLRHALWRVRKALEAASSTRFVEADDLIISFKAKSDYWLDVAELKKLNESASVEELIAVLSEYQGELLPGFYDEWVLLEREHLYSIFEHHLARLISLLQAEKRWRELLDWGEHWIKLGQKPEAAYRAIMTAYAAQGDMSKVAATYERCTNSLRELGVKPSVQTRLLYERLTVGEEGHEAQSSLVEKAENRRKANLPIPITSFIGREKEAAAVIKLVETNRLVTLTGPGGVGKTRLAIESSNQLVDNFKDGVWWVELAVLSDEALVPQAVAQGLGVRESPGQPLTESVTGFLREKHLLLVLDNCEHLISASAQLSYDLLTQCVNLRILTTSREALDVMGEVEYPVQSLSLPAVERLTLVDLMLEYDGIRLFVERAIAKSGFTLSEQNAPVVLQICQQLDGIPLALELAAARTKMLTVEQIAERLHDRFNLLTQGNRTALPRHRTLRAAIVWSHDLLSREERILFHRLAVFAGGWTLEEAEKVCSDDDIKTDAILSLLSHLVDKSLVIMRTQQREVRYRMLETIRQYADEKLTELGETKRAGKRHLEFFVQFVEECEPKLKGSEQIAWLDQLQTEHDNIRAALGWALGHQEVEDAARLAVGLYLFWLLRDHLGEGRQWLEQIIGLSRGIMQIKPVSLDIQILFARTLNHASFLAGFQGDYSTGRSRAEEGLLLARKVGNKKLVSEALVAHGYAAMGLKDYAAARALLEESLILTRELGNKNEIRRSLASLGSLALNQRDYTLARMRYEEALLIAHELGDKYSVAVFTSNLGHVALNEDNYTTARGHYVEALSLCRELRSERFIIVNIVGLAGLARAQGQLERATILSSAVETLCESINSHLDTDEQFEHESTLSMARTQLDEATFNQLWQAGHGMTLEQAIEIALKESGNRTKHDLTGEIQPKSNSGNKIKKDGHSC